jgi:hypothetical protein
MCQQRRNLSLGVIEKGQVSALICHTSLIEYVQPFGSSPVSGHILDKMSGTLPSSFSGYKIKEI